MESKDLADAKKYQGKLKLLTGFHGLGSERGRENCQLENHRQRARLVGPTKPNGRWQKEAYRSNEKKHWVSRTSYTALALMNLLAKEPSFTEGKYLESKKKALEYPTSILGK